MTTILVVFFLVPTQKSWAESGYDLIWNIGYGLQTEYHDHAVGDLFGMPTMISGQAIAYKPGTFVAGSSSLWYAQGKESTIDATLNQYGASVGLKLYIPLTTDQFGLHFLAGPSFLYQTTELDAPFMDTSERGGFGYSLGGAAMMMFGDFGFNLRVENIMTESGDLDVGHLSTSIGISFRM